MSIFEHHFLINVAKHLKSWNYHFPKIILNIITLIVHNKEADIFLCRWIGQA